MKKMHPDDIVEALDDIANDISDLQDLIRRRTETLGGRLSVLSQAVFHLDDDAIKLKALIKDAYIVGDQSGSITAIMELLATSLNKEEIEECKAKAAGWE